MDQIKIGKFIAEERKKKGMTQRALADALSVSDKTVSKWECGKGLPEVSLMMPLCDLLSITVNELLTGERLDDSQYQRKAEENMMRLMKEKEENMKKIWLQAGIFGIVLLAMLSLTLVAGLAELSTSVRITLIVIAGVITALGIAVAVVLDRDTGYYECRYCKKRFVPTMREYIWSAHTVTTRRLRCPHCGKKSYCKKRLSNEEQDK